MPDIKKKKKDRKEIIKFFNTEPEPTGSGHVVEVHERLWIPEDYISLTLKNVTDLKKKGQEEQKETASVTYELQN